MKRHIPAAALAVAAALLLAGCYDDVDTTLYEAHQYKGSDDPLLSKLEQSDLQNQLEQRFQQGQRDR